MPSELWKAPSLYGVGDKEPITPGEFQQETVKANTEVTVWSKQVGQDQRLFHGHGREDREYAEAFVGLDLVASGNSAGTADENISGKVVLAITDSDQRRVLASATYDSLGQLRDALAENRTNRLVENAMQPFAKPGRHLEIRIEADAGADGYEIDPAASSGVLYYTRVSV